jgi:hypothetical protein
MLLRLITTSSHITNKAPTVWLIHVTLYIIAFTNTVAWMSTDIPKMYYTRLLTTLVDKLYWMISSYVNEYAKMKQFISATNCFNEIARTKKTSTVVFVMYSENSMWKTWKLRKMHSTSRYDLDICCKAHCTWLWYQNMLTKAKSCSTKSHIQYKEKRKLDN